ncbi:hypothetical protein PHLCEN_2v4311, partial [Hermanssonia centrifuga]
PPSSQIRACAAAALATSEEEQWEITNDAEADKLLDEEEGDKQVADNHLTITMIIDCHVVSMA